MVISNFIFWMWFLGTLKKDKSEPPKAGGEDEDDDDFDYYIWR